MKECVVCNTLLNGRQTKFCSNKCNSKYYGKLYSITPEKRREYNQNWKKKDYQKYLKYMKKGTDKYKKNHPEKVSEYNARYRKKYPLRNKIRKIAGKSISTNGKQCEKCGSTKNLHRHHTDYSKPLEVNILCSHCHLTHHGTTLRVKVE